MRKPFRNGSIGRNQVRGHLVSTTNETSPRSSPRIRTMSSKKTLLCCWWLIASLYRSAPYPRRRSSSALRTFSSSTCGLPRRTPPGSRPRSSWRPSCLHSASASLYTQRASVASFYTRCARVHGGGGSGRRLLAQTTAGCASQKSVSILSIHLIPDLPAGGRVPIPARELPTTAPRQKTSGPPRAGNSDCRTGG